MSSLGTPESALNFLYGLERAAKDPNEQSVYRQQILKTKNEINIKRLESLLQQYSSKNGIIPKELGELLPPEKRETLLHDPFGGHYYLDQNDGKIKNSKESSGTLDK